MRRLVSYIMVILTIWMSSGIASFSAAQSQQYAEIEGDRIRIPLGQTGLIPSYEVKRVALGNGKLAEVRVLEETSEILIIGNAEGVTDLRVWDRHQRHRRYILEIVNRANVSHLEQVKGLVRSIEGISARQEGDFIVIEGESVDESASVYVERLASMFPNVLSRVVRPSVALPQMVMLDVKMVEMRRNELKNLGIRWGGKMSGPKFEVQNRKSRFGILSALSSDIELMESKGYVRVLAEPTLMAQSGARAEFLAGGEVPIPVKTDDGISVMFKNYGIILNIEPLADKKGQITTRVEVEISSVDHSVQVMGVPGFLTRKTDTVMNVLSGQTMVLSGLVNSIDSKDISKIPLIGEIPILGELFKSREFLNEQTELVVFVTPHLVEPNSEKIVALQERAESQISKSNDLLNFSILD